MFIACENSEKLRHELSHNIRTSGDIKYLTDHSVNFKNLDSKSWHGPAKVLKQDGQHVLNKNGSRHITVHPCQLQLINHNNENTSSNFTQTSQDTTPSQHQFPNPKNPTPIQQTTYESDTNDDCDNSCINNYDTPSSISKELTIQSEQQPLNDEHTTLSEKPPVGNIIPEIQQSRKIQPNYHIK